MAQKPENLLFAQEIGMLVSATYCKTCPESMDVARKDVPVHFA